MMHVGEKLGAFLCQRMCGRKRSRQGECVVEAVGEYLM